MGFEVHIPPMIVVIASAWSASAGGVNAFSIELTRSLARVGERRVACAVTSATGEERLSAAVDGVTLIVVDGHADGRPMDHCGTSILETLRLQLADRVDLWIGHDLVSGQAASIAAASHGGRLALIHHMDYGSYQNFGGDRPDETIANVRRQIALFGNPEATLFGVGEWLRQNVARLGGQEARAIIPGFPAIRGVSSRRSADRLLVLTAGRFSAATEHLKRIGTALDGFALAARDARDLPLLRRAAMTVLGVDEADMQVLLHKRAAKIADRPINVAPAGFDDDPTAVAELASRNHVVIVPSRHEGFGLVGWEAIGTGTPLIIGAGTGLAHQLGHTLDGSEKGLITILDLDGSERDCGLIAEAIRTIAADLPAALRRAERLRTQLAAELSCDWGAAATDLLAAVGLRLEPETIAVRSTTAPSTGFVDDRTNKVARCVELALGAGQGSTRLSVHLVAELRFGTMEIEIDDIQAEVRLDRVTLEVSPRTGRLKREDRLGEGARVVPGIKARAGGIWLVEPTTGDHLEGKVMGDETLCVIETTGERPAAVDVEITAARGDVHCRIRSGRKLSRTVQKVMGVFLAECVRKPVSGHAVLSTASVEEDVR